MQDRGEFSERCILRLTDHGAPYPAQDQFGREVDGRGVQQDDALCPGVTRHDQADTVTNGLSRIVTTRTWLEEQQSKQKEP